MRSSKREGFTLIEVLVALAILGTGLFVLLEAQYASLTLFDQAQEEVLMRLFMAQAIGWAEAEVHSGENGGEGDFGDRYPGFGYSYVASETDKEGMPGLLEVVVRVRGPLDEREMKFFLYDGNQVETE